MNRKPFVIGMIIFMILVQSCAPFINKQTKGTATARAVTPTLTKPNNPNTEDETLTPTAMVMDTDTPFVSDTPPASDTPAPVTATEQNTATATTGSVTLPYPSAPLCPHGAETDPEHDRSAFHTLWDSARGCHYDHEHGTNPFTPEVAALFAGYDLKALLGGVEINYTNPSSPMENTHKHGGWKWDVMLANPHGCLAGFEGALWCVKAAIVGYHAFGNYSIEMQARQHSAVYLLLVCDPAHPNDCGTFFMGNLEDYGQRVSPYQTTVIYTIAQGCTVDNACPVNPSPYAAPSGPYNTIDCVYLFLPGCRTNIGQIILSNLNTASKWTSKLTGIGARPPGNRLADLLFDVRDTYQVFDSRDLAYPFTFAWVCSPNNNGLSYNPIGCKHNNTATAVHEVGGVIPTSLDNLAGFDTNSVIGRITTNSFVDELGNPDLTCTVAGASCYPIKMTNMFVGKYGDYLTLNKISLVTPGNTPSRNIFFCNGVVCTETTPGAVPSGWPGAEN